MLKKAFIQGKKAKIKTNLYGVRRSAPISNENSVGINNDINNNLGQNGHNLIYPKREVLGFIKGSAFNDSLELFI